MRPLYPPQAPFRSHAVPVSHGHVLHVAESGRPDGLPALLLHGGPGSGCTPLLSRFFDPVRYRVACVDQRGAGRSTPRGGTAHNTTAELIADLELVRRRLAITRWLVVGGSWGATLAVAYAAAHPQVVAGLLLRAVFLARAEDVGAFFRPSGSADADAWARLNADVRPDAGQHLLDALAQGLQPGDDARSSRLAQAWWHWESARSGTPPGAEPEGDALQALVDRYRVQAHYLRHDCWLVAPPLLERAAALPAVPTLLLHGREDRVCLPEGAVQLHARLPHGGRLLFVDGVGHDPSHPAMASAMVEALDAYAAEGRFEPTAPAP